MALRSGHGTGAGVPRIEVLPPDELPAPIADAPAPLRRHPNGQINGSETAKALGALGGKAKAARTRLLSALGLTELASDAAFAQYRSAGEAFVTEHLTELAKQGDGVVGPGPSSIVSSAGLQLAASRFVSDKAAAEGNAKLFHLASTLANDSRQNLLAAYELQQREATARKKAAARGSGGLAAAQARILGGAK